MPDLWSHERALREQGYLRIAGLDEAGRGPLAGPVVAAAVVLPPSFSVAGVFDSKQVPEKKREALFDEIHAHADGVGVGIATPAEIDQLNILRASLLAMTRAVEALHILPDYLLVDGTFKTGAPLPQSAIPKGDALSISIAAASIIAKVTRDRLMCQCHQAHPEYGFDAHKGYPTEVHRAAIRRHGCLPIHRKTFKGVREFL